ncbi:hypothetical protein [Chlorogloea sp. CCALA 695]|uniref:hypothetical protein n=1 Tax=Chlorogloea sp. CCALA 695 TaxID=2107693 RepID=UPI0018EBF854|nr:hypothetical protein [Chlorogloea sp. CCALA 695]
MAGRFEGLSDLEWKLFEELLPQPSEKRGRGMPHSPFRKVLNTQHLRADYWLPMVRYPARRTMGIKKFCSSLALRDGAKMEHWKN